MQHIRKQTWIFFLLTAFLQHVFGAASSVTDPGDPVCMGGVVGRTAEPGPLAQAFENYHFETILDCMKEVMGGIRDHSEKAHPDRPPVVLSGNPAGGMHVPRWVEVAAPFDYFNIECDVVSLGQDRHLAHFLATSALAEAVDTTLLVMPNAMSNKRWGRQEDPIAYAQATGLAYALGGHMHVPWCLYDGSQFTRFYGSLEGHQPIFGMIHEYADWFDGYTTPLWHVLEVPYGADGAGDLHALESRVLAYVEHGVPTVLRLTGDHAPGGGGRFSGTARHTTVFGPGKAESAADSPFVADASFAASFLPPLPRVAAEASAAPLVLHLIRRFDDENRKPAGGGFTVFKSFLNGAKVTGVEIAAPRWQDLPAAEVEWEMADNGDLVIAVKHIPAWAVLRIRTAEAVLLPGIARAPLRESMAESEIPLMRMIRFSDIWQRPQWVDEALAADTDPLDGYHITRISWSYDHSLQTLEYAQTHDMAFHGSDCFLHTYMALDGTPPQEGIPTFTPDWPGWARYPDGHPMHIRPDFLPPRYGASFASPEYRTAMTERGKGWIDKGAAGIQFDDINGMVNRVWQYGGDFSDTFFTRFRQYLVERGMDGVKPDTPLEVLRERVMEEMDYTFAYQRLPDGTVAVPRKTRTGYPGLVWVGSPAFPRPDRPFAAEAEIRFTDSAKPHAELLLMDGDRSVYLSRIPVHELLPPGDASGEWIKIRLRFDPAAQTVEYRIGHASGWSAPKPFDAPVPEGADTFSLAVMVDPRQGGVEVRNPEDPNIECMQIDDPCIEGESGSAVDRPNVLLIYTDDERWDAIGYTNPFVHTPNIDRFASQGIRFEQATIVLPVCSPSRAAVLTGRYGQANGVTTYHTPLASGERTFFRYFTEEDYLTAMIGKWHVVPEDLPYSHFSGFMTPPDGASDFPPVFHDFEEVRDLGNSRDYWEPLLIRNGKPERLRGTTSIDFVVDETIRLIQRAGKEDRPFAIYLSTLEPHNRMWKQGKEYLSEAVKNYYEENPLDGLPIPPNIHDDLEKKPPYLKSYRGRVKRVGERGQNPMTPGRFRDSVYRVHAMISEVDRAMARLFEVLEKENLMENTYVVFMGDNGLFEGEHGFMSKGLHYEESVRVPLFVVGPGIRPGVDDQSLPTNIDLAPTLLDFAGLEIPEKLHGQSLRPVLEGGSPLDRDFVLLEHPEANPVLEVRPAFSLRSRDWKYIRTFENGPGEPATFEELYDLRQDPFELKNLAGNEDQKSRLERFRKKLESLRNQVRS